MSQEISFEDVFGDKEIKDTAAPRKGLEPTVEKLADGSLQINSPVVGVELDSLVYDEKLDAAIFWFSKDGKTIPKFVNNPYTNKYITEIEDDVLRAKRQKDVLLEIQRNVANFIYYNTVLKSIPKKFSFQTYVEALGELVKTGESRTPNDVSLKITFKNVSGVKPEFVVPNYAYLSNQEKYPILWGKKIDDDTPAVPSNDSKGYGFTNFTVEEKQADFSNEAADVADVFGGGADVELL